MLGRLVEQLSGKPLEAFAREHVFDPLGIRRFEWRFDPDRSSINTFCQLSLTLRDVVKIGLLYMNGGRWRDARCCRRTGSKRPQRVTRR